MLLGLVVFHSSLDAIDRPLIIINKAWATSVSEPPPKSHRSVFSIEDLFLLGAHLHNVEVVQHPNLTRKRAFVVRGRRKGNMLQCYRHVCS